MPGDHVIDLGAGTGLLTLAALALVGPAGKVSAVDLSPEALRTIRPAPSGGTLCAVVADITEMPLGDGCADAVVGRSVLNYVKDLAAAFAEAARVTRPGGRLSVFEPINAGRHHDAVLTGLTPDELAAIQQALKNATPAARSMTAFDEQRVVAAATTAGLLIEDLSIDTATETLTDQAAVDAHLHRTSHPAAPTHLETVTSALGPDAARRYADAWRDAMRTQHVITYTTPLLYLTATIPGVDHPKGPTARE